MDAPISASHPRPNNQPYYIEKNCPHCGEALVLRDLFNDPSTPANEIWHDEFTCPKHNDGVFMDWPDDGRRLDSEQQ